MSEPIRKPDENPSRVESILSDTIGLSGYEIEAPRSRIEILLLELEELIKEGGGGGESSNYGTSISIEMDSNFVMSASLLNKDGEVLGEVQTVDLPLESVVVNGSYDSINKQVVLTLQNGSAVRFSVADLVDGLQTEITSQNPLDADLVSDSNSTHKFTTASDISKLAGIEPQANKTTVDDALSGSSTNPVQNKVVKTALDSKADTSTTYTKTEVDTALSGKQNVIDSSHKLSADLVDDISATHKFATVEQLAQIETNKNNISTLAESGGAKNLCATNSATYMTPSGYKDAIVVNLSAGTYVLSFTYTSTGNAAVEYTVDGAATTKYFDADTDKRLYYTITATTAFTSFRFYINANMTVSNIMVCTKAQWDISHTYQPYTMSNTELTAKEQVNENNISTANAGLIELVDNGAKNKLPNKGTMTKDDITYTWTGGDVVVSGTKSAGANYVEVLPLTELSDLGFSVGDEFVISNNGTNCYLSIIFWSKAQSYSSSIDIVSGSNVVTIPTGYTHMLARLGVKSATTGTVNETIQPMICSKAVWDISHKYVPYAPTNAELYAMIQALQP